MRPVTKDRKSPKNRGASGRMPSRGITRGPASAHYGSRVRQDGLFARLERLAHALLEARRPMLWVTVMLVCLFAIAALASKGFFGRTAQRTDAAAGTLVSDAGFGVSQVHLAGNMRTTPADIMSALGIRAGQAIFSVDLRVARARLLRLPWVADAEVKRRYPDDISVQVVERVPYARWQKPDGLYVVERDGYPITKRGADTFVHLPLLIGDDAPRMAEAFVNSVAAHRAIAARVEAYQYVARRRWNLLLDDGVIVKLPEDGWQKQLQVLDHLIVDKGILEADIREIDLRHPNYYFFTRRHGAEQKEKKAETGSAI